MAQLDRLQPSLLDRLTDDAPGSREETRDRRVISLQRLREAVLRDLTWLLNTTDLSSVEDLADHAFVAESVLNYGLPALAGRSVSNLDVAELERRVRQAILRYEPRILRNSLRIKAVAEEGRMTHNALFFDIEGQLWAQPAPLRLLLRTEVDLESGAVTVRDRAGHG